jgi:hypothetical protein
VLLSLPGSDYQLAAITLDAGNARDIWLMLTDAHAVLDDLAAAPGTARRAAASLRAAGSPYTLPALITALDQVTTMLAHAARDAINDACAAGPPAGQPGYTRPAIDVITQAASAEHDFAGWLAGALANAAARLGSSDALTAARPGSWEASLVDQLVKGTVGYDDELLPCYAG